MDSELESKFGSDATDEQGEFVDFENEVDDEDLLPEGIDNDDELARRARIRAATRVGSPVPMESLAAQVEAEPDDEDSDLPEGRFAERELSWLAFNARVLEQAEDQTLPLLERAWFLSIFSSNLDEFFMVRVAGLKRRIATGLAVPSAAGLSPRQVLEGITEGAHELMARHAAVFSEDVQPKLAEVGIDINHWDQLEDLQREGLRKMFRSDIFPVLTPLAVHPAHPFPYISGLSLNLAVVVRNPNTGKEHFARVKVPPLLPVLSRSIMRDARIVPRMLAHRRGDGLRSPRRDHRCPPGYALPGHGGRRIRYLPRDTQRGCRGGGR